MNTFVNLTNHPSSRWGADQLAAARQYGEIVDVPFPSVDPEASADAIGLLADKYVDAVRRYENPLALVQGEFTLAFSIVKRLQQMGIKAVATCSVREVKEQIKEDGASVKQVTFRFRGFREYI